MITTMWHPCVALVLIHSLNKIKTIKGLNFKKNGNQLAALCCADLDE